MELSVIIFVFCSSDRSLNVMMPLFNRTGLERVGVVGPEPGLLWTGMKALDVMLLCKNKKEERAGRGFACSRSNA